MKKIRPTHKYPYIARACAFENTRFLQTALNRLNWILVGAIVLVGFLTASSFGAEKKASRSEQASSLRASLKAEKNRQRRQEIYQQIGDLKKADAVSFLDDTDHEAREAAALAIGRDKAAAAVKDDLLPLAKTDSDLAVRTAAIQSLGNHHEGFADLVGMLNDATQPVAVRQAAASALSLFRTDDARQALVRQEQSESEGELKEHLTICLESWE